MGKKEKLIARFKQLPKDFTYDELKQLVGYFGYSEDNQGRTSGSRVTFRREKDNCILYLHKPHPGNIIPSYKMKHIYDALKERGDID